MKRIHMKQKLMISALAGAVMIPGSALTVKAEKQSAGSMLWMSAGIEAALDGCYDVEGSYRTKVYLVRTDEGEYLNRAFANVSGYTYIRESPEETKEWIGKLYEDSTVTIMAYDGDWARIQSGSVEGYVPVRFLYTGEEAKQHESEFQKYRATVTADVLNVRAGQGTDTEILSQIPENTVCEVTGSSDGGWYPIKTEDTKGWVSGEYVKIDTYYSYAELKGEEGTGIFAGAVEKQAAHAFGTVRNGENPDDTDNNIEETQSEQDISGQNVAENISAGQVGSSSDVSQGMQGDTAAQEAWQQGTTGQAVVDFACQFIGNPYVWGGTSLTEGADCSGFVQSVYAHFGISLPRTTWDMESVGTEVSYEQAMPGDLVLYDGHVGLYMGNGNIVDAMNEQDGIGICSAEYAPIITVRRVL